MLKRSDTSLDIVIWVKHNRELHIDLWGLWESITQKITLILDGTTIYNGILAKNREAWRGELIVLPISKEGTELRDHMTWEDSWNTQKLEVYYNSNDEEIDNFLQQWELIKHKIRTYYMNTSIKK